MSDVSKRDLVLAAIGMGLGAAGGALIHPLASQKPRAGGYAASAVAGAAVGAPTTLLIAKLMQDKKNPALDTWKQVNRGVTGFFDQLFGGENGIDIDGDKHGRRLATVVKSLGGPIKDPKLLGIPAGGIFLGRVWNPFDLKFDPAKHPKLANFFDNKIPQGLKSIHRQRTNYIDGLIRLHNLTGASEAHARTIIGGRGIQDIQINGSRVPTARKAIKSAGRYKALGIGGYALASLISLLKDQESTKVWK